jgi:hypothetical protein
VGEKTQAKMFKSYPECSRVVSKNSLRQLKRKFIYKFSGFSPLEKWLPPPPKEKLVAVPMAPFITQNDGISDRIIIGAE